MNSLPLAERLDTPVVVGTQKATSAAPPRALWDDVGMLRDGRGEPYANSYNVVRLVEGHRELRGCVWFDEFTQRTMTNWRGRTREWFDGDTQDLSVYIQSVAGISRIAESTIDSAISVAARANRRNSAQEWLCTLKWDGVERLQSLLSRGFGASESEYTSSVGRCFMVGMVARVMRPGCKVDTMPVFEGVQGGGKSSTLQALVGAEWFAEATADPDSKDFFVALQGKVLVEIGELDAFRRSDVTTVKRMLSCQSDRFRGPYERYAKDRPRTCVFAGTTNRDDWNRDETGARRFWPVACGVIDQAWIVASREQLFAEALARLHRGESWWDVPAEDAKREQDARREVDEWEVPIARYVEGRCAVEVAEVLDQALKMTPDRWTKPFQMRVGAILRGMGWVKKDARLNGRKTKFWTAPNSDASDAF